MRFIYDSYTDALSKLRELLSSNVHIILAIDRMQLLNAGDRNGSVSSNSPARTPQASDDQWFAWSINPGAAIHPHFSEGLDSLLAQFFTLRYPQDCAAASRRQPFGECFRCCA
jgi:hypothetical protein